MLVNLTTDEAIDHLQYLCEYMGELKTPNSHDDLDLIRETANRLSQLALDIKFETPEEDE